MVSKILEERKLKKCIFCVNVVSCPLNTWRHVSGDRGLKISLVDIPSSLIAIMTNNLQIFLTPAYFCLCISHILDDILKTELQLCASPTAKELQSS
jgi:hypothetical protein